MLDAIQFIPDDTEVELTVVHGNEEPRKVTVKPIAAEDAFIAARGFCFQPIERIRTAESFSEQVRYGWNETSEALTMVFRFLRKLGTQVPMSALGGPVTIAKAAGYSAAEGLSSLLVFLTMLSANLAVLNLLPIPLLDGGHLVFLAYEGIRGRPANEKFVIALHTIGFVLIVSLMLYVFALDLEPDPAQSVKRKKISSPAAGPADCRRRAFERRFPARRTPLRAAGPTCGAPAASAWR